MSTIYLVMRKTIDRGSVVSCYPIAAYRSQRRANKRRDDATTRQAERNTLPVKVVFLVESITLE